LANFLEDLLSIWTKFIFIQKRLLIVPNPQAFCSKSAQTDKDDLKCLKISEILLKKEKRADFPEIYEVCADKSDRKPPKVETS